MKVLRVITSVNKNNGGPINGLINSSKDLVDLGCTVEVACLDSPDDKWVADFDFTVHCFSSSLGLFSYSKEFGGWLDKSVSKYDIVIIHGLWQFHSYRSAVACIKNKIPFVVFTHGMLDPWFNKQSLLKKIKKNIYWKIFEYKTINYANAVLFTSEEEKLLARNSFSPYKAIECVVSYGSRAPNIKKDKAVSVFLESFPELVGKEVLLFLSRIDKKKGIDLLVESLSEKDDIPSNFVLAIAGPDNSGFKKELEEKIKKSGVSKSIVWLGMLSGDLKWGAYYYSDFFILPSHQENFGIVVSEALSTGTPVLITNKVNIWREILSSKAGLVENDDVSGINKLLDAWFNMSDTVKDDMSRSAELCFKNRFSIEKASSDLLDVLKKNASN